jgi:uncharacterized membrane protein YbhN (UPF0104 family)
MVPRWYRFARMIGFVILAAVTIYGLRELVTGDWEAVMRYGMAKLPWLPIILGFFLLDLLFEGVAWVWVYERFKIRAADAMGAGVYLSGNAGLLMPAQLGRLIRPDSMVRLGRGSLADCVKAEGSVFVLDSLSVMTLLAGLVVWRFQPALAPVAGLSMIAVALFLGDRIANRLAGTRLDLPRGFWWHWKSWAIVFVEMLGWGMHGVAFFILVADLPGNLTLWDALFYAPGSAVLGVGSGLPGGVGATEGLLGVTLRFNEVPAEHLALVVTAFRIVTFWLRLPIGWFALAVVRRKAAKAEVRGWTMAPAAAATVAEAGGSGAHVDK